MLKRTCFWKIGIVTTALLLSGIPRPIVAEELTDEEVQQMATPLIANGRVDGLSIGIVEGQQQRTLHLGQWCPGQGSPDDETIYEIGSITKVFTGILLAMEADGDRSFLLEPIDVPAVGVDLPDYQGQRIHWLDMATHRSGLPRLPTNLTDIRSDNPYADYGSDKAIEFLSTYELPRRPSTQYEYSNFAFSWLGHLLTHRDGASSYERMLEKRITRSLRMDDTGVNLTANQQRRLATPHSTAGVPTSTWEFADMPGAGGIRSTTADMMKFLRAVIAPDSIGPDRQLARGIDLAWSKHQESSDQNFAMGLGWQIARDGKTRWHNGQTGGFHCVIFVNRDLQLGVVVLANTSDAAEIESLAENLMRRLAGESIRTENHPPTVEVDLQTMKRLEGRYQLTPAFVLDIKVLNHQLMVGVTNQPTLRVFPARDNRWFYRVIDAELDFDLPPTGSAKSVVLIQNGIRQKAMRLPPP